LRDRKKDETKTTLYAMGKKPFLLDAQYLRQLRNTATGAHYFWRVKSSFILWLYDIYGPGDPRCRAVKLDFAERYK
jgi:hypothetical protein